MKQPILKGGSYTIFARIGSHNQLIIEHIEPMVEPNQVHVFLQIPQYVLLTAAEVMFSIPSMQFAYTQVSIRRLMGSTDQADPSYFYFRMS